MTHGDDTGLMLPPRVAPIQVKLEYLCMQFCYGDPSWFISMPTIGASSIVSSSPSKLIIKNMPS